MIRIRGFKRILTKHFKAFEGVGGSKKNNLGLLIDGAVRCAHAREQKVGPVAGAIPPYLWEAELAHYHLPLREPTMPYVTVHC